MALSALDLGLGCARSWAGLGLVLGCVWVMAGLRWIFLSNRRRKETTAFLGKTAQTSAPALDVPQLGEVLAASGRNTLLDIDVQEGSGLPAPRGITAAPSDFASHVEEHVSAMAEHAVDLTHSRQDMPMATPEVAQELPHLTVVRNTFLDIYVQDGQGPPTRAKTAPPSVPPSAAREYFPVAIPEVAQDDHQFDDALNLQQGDLPSAVHKVVQDGPQSADDLNVQQRSVLPAPNVEEDSASLEVAQKSPQLGEGIRVSVRNTFLELDVEEGSRPPPRFKTEPPTYICSRGDFPSPAAVHEVESKCNTFPDDNVQNGSGPAPCSKTASSIAPALLNQAEDDPQFTEAFVDLTNEEDLPTVIHEVVPSVTPTQPLQATSEGGMKQTFHSGICCVQSKFTKAKVSGGDIRLVSKEFKLAFGKDFLAVPFKFVLLPLTLNFKNNHGKGYLQLQYFPDSENPAPAANIHFRFSVGSGGSSSSCDVVAHDFSRQMFCKLSKVWDFKSAAEKSGDKSVLVTLEILPPTDGSW